jgi:hypothetical protein
MVHAWLYERTVPFPTGDIGIKSRILKRARFNIRQLPFINIIFLSHEDYDDNLYEAGRQLLIGRHRVLSML